MRPARPPLEDRADGGGRAGAAHRSEDGVGLQTRPAIGDTRYAGRRVSHFPSEVSNVTAFNVVRFRVKPGAQQLFIESHVKMKPNFKGFVHADLVRTGERTFCLIGEWRDFKSIVDARPAMIAFLDTMRPLLEDLGGDLGRTDPVSGESVARLGGANAPKKKTGKKTSKAGKKTGKQSKRKAKAKK
jgi:hypothetical protein